MRSSENQPGLTDYLTALWNRKWLIIVATLGLVIVVAVISLLTPPVWEVEMIIQPAKFLSQTQAGLFIDVLMADPRQIATAINQKSYDHAIAKELKIDIHDFPILRADFLKDTKLVKIATNAKNVEKAMAVLQTLFLHLKKSLDKNILIEINTIDTEIKKNELQIDFLTKEFAILDNKLKILERREREILAEKKTARERIARIEKEQVDALQAGGKEFLSQLVYSNIIQQNYQYINTLDELISDKRIQSEDLVNKRKENEQSIEVLKSSVNNLIEKKGKFDYTQMIKEPTSSVFPTSPKKKLNVLLAGILGVMISSLAALFLEYLDKARAGGKHISG